MAAAALTKVVATGKKIYKAYKMVKTASGVKKAIKSKDWKGAVAGIGGLGVKIPGLEGVGDSTIGATLTQGILPGLDTSKIPGMESGNIFDKFKMPEFDIDGKKILSKAWKYGAIASDVKQFRQKYKRIKELKNMKLNIPSMEDFERNRDEQMDILDTDPSQLENVFGPAMLRKHGIDPANLDAQAQFKKRQVRNELMGQQDEMARQCGRSGMMGSSAMAAAATQLGLQGSQMDAQMGLEASKLFTQQIANLQSRMEGNTRDLMSMEESMANWELNKQQQAYDMEQQFYKDTASAMRKAELGLDEPKTTTWRDIEESQKATTGMTDEEFATSYLEDLEKKKAEGSTDASEFALTKEGMDRVRGQMIFDETTGTWRMKGG